MDAGTVGTVGAAEAVGAVGPVGAAGHRRAIVALAWPVYVELLAGVVAGIIDVAWVAHLGPAQTAAVALATNLENLVMGVAFIAAAGTTVLIAARGTAAGRRAAVRGGVTLTAAVTVAVVGGGLAFRGPVVGMFFDTGDAHRAALDYLAISVPGLAVYFGQLIVDAVFKGLGDTRTPMRLAMGTNALILVLDPTLIYAAGFGVRGAAVATVAGRAAMLGVGVAVVRRRSLGPLPQNSDAVTAEDPARSPAEALPRRLARSSQLTNQRNSQLISQRSNQLTGQLINQPTNQRAKQRINQLVHSAFEVARAGAPLGIDFLVRMAGATALAGVVAGFGVVAVAAYGIGTKAMYFASMAFYAVRQAAAIHSARNASEPRIGSAAVAVGGLLGGVAALVYAGAAPWIMGVFTGQAEVVAVGVVFLRWLALYLVPMSVVISLSGALAAGRGGRLLLPVTVGGTVALVAAAHLMAGPFGLAGVWAAMTGSAALQCAALLVMFRRRSVSAGRRP